LQVLRMGEDRELLEPISKDKRPSDVPIRVRS